MKTCKPSRREREKLRQRQEILDVALNLFSKKGYHNISMHEIAKEAEFAIGTLYKFFRNKEDLYQAIEEEIGPKRDAYLSIRADEAELDSILHAGAERARQVAHATIQRVRSAVGID